MVAKMGRSIVEFRDLAVIKNGLCLLFFFFIFNKRTLATCNACQFIRKMCLLASFLLSSRRRF